MFSFGKEMKHPSPKRRCLMNRLTELLLISILGQVPLLSEDAVKAYRDLAQ